MSESRVGMKDLIRLAGPVVLALLAQMLMGTVDLIAVGRVSPTAVGAVGLANSLYAWVMIFGIGLLASLDFLVSRAFGAGNPEDGRKSLGQGLLLAIIVSFPLVGLLWILSYNLSSMGIEAGVARDAGQCVRILAPSLLPFLIFFSCRMYLQAVGKVRVPMLILVFANLVNVAANYFFVFGHAGLPAMGAAGAAMSTLVSRSFMAAAILYVLRETGAKLSLRLDRERMREILKMGIPSAMQLVFEVGVFSLVTLLAGTLAPVVLAAHQVVLNIASLAFMVPLGISSATAVMVGRAVGAKRPATAARSGNLGILLAVGFMTFSSICMLTVPNLLLGAFTQDAQVVSLSKGILLLAGIFQLSDGAQVALTGALRGLGNTRFAMIWNLVGHWLIGLPIGYFLCFNYGFGLQGLWIGLAAGLTSVALSLTWKWRREAHFVMRSS